MLILTTEAMPVGLEVAQVFAMIEVTAPIRISAKGLIESLIARKDGNQHQGTIDAFEAQARLNYPTANMIIGVKVTSAVFQAQNGTFLYLTYIGNPARYEKRAVER